MPNKLNPNRRRKRAGLPLPKNCPIRAKNYYMLTDYWDGHVYTDMPKVVRVEEVKSLYIKMGHKVTSVFYKDLIADAIYEMGKCHYKHTLVKSCDIGKFVEVYKEVRREKAYDEVAMAALANL